MTPPVEELAVQSKNAPTEGVFGKAEAGEREFFPWRKRFDPQDLVLAAGLLGIGFAGAGA